MVVDGGGEVVSIVGGFTANLLTFNAVAGGGSEGSGGSGSLTLSTDHSTLTGTGKDTNGDIITFKLTREN
jgi:hypothetical protein